MTSLPVDDFKVEIRSLLAPMHSSMQGRSHEVLDRDQKICAIAEIIAKFPQCYEDKALMSKVIEYSKASRNLKIRVLRNSWIEQTFTHMEYGIRIFDTANFPSQEIPHYIFSDPSYFDRHAGNLFFTEKSFRDCSREDFWNFIRNNDVDQLVVKKTDGQPAAFERVTLRHIKHIKFPVPLSAFLENIRVNFKYGYSIVLPKATLCCCGNFFGEEILKREEIQLDITINGFSGILNIIEKGQFLNVSVVEEWEAAAGYLQFLRPWKTHENCLGMQLFSKSCFKPDCFSAMQWYEWFWAIEEMKVEFKNEIVFGIDPGFSIDEMEGVIQNPSNGKTSRIHTYDKTVRLYFGRKSTKPCLFVRTKTVLKIDRIYLYEDHLKHLTLRSTGKDFSYQPPTAREAVVSECLHFLKTGERLLENVLTFTSDKYSGSQIAVGHTTTSGFKIDTASYKETNGLIAFRRFYAK